MNGARNPWARLAWLCLLTLAAVLPAVFWTRTDDTVRTPQWVFLWTVAALGVASHVAAGLPLFPRGHVLRAPLLAVALGAVLLPFTAFRFSTAILDGLGVLAGVGVAGMASTWLTAAARRTKIGW